LLASRTAVPEDFTRPGHILPLIAAEGGVLERNGHTEAAIDLMILAGLRPVAGIAEVVADDGEMLRLPGLEELGARDGVPVITIAELVHFIRAHGREPLGQQAAARG
jgi:3,4-dihydroxy 2-butanone 4-phosphate synthase/GTP cyclohydrolase II